MLLILIMAVPAGFSLAASAASERQVQQAVQENLPLFGHAPPPLGRIWVLQELNGRDIAPFLAMGLPRPSLTVTSADRVRVIFEAVGFNGRAYTATYSRHLDSSGATLEYDDVADLCEDPAIGQLNQEWQRTWFSSQWCEENGSLELVENGVVRASLVPGLAIPQESVGHCPGGLY